MTIRVMSGLLGLLFLSTMACRPDVVTTDDTASPGGSGQDLLSTAISLDLADLTGTAVVTARPAEDHTLRLDVSGLSLSAVSVDGVAVEPAVQDGWLTVTGGEAVEVEIDYAFESRSPVSFDGWMPGLGVSFVWPYYCGNLFPCDPSLRDGIVYSMDVTGIESGLTAIFPTSTVSDGPAYMAGVAVGDYTELDLGETSHGTALRAWYFTENGDTAATRGTRHLVEVFDFFETTYGPYAFGPEYGSVEVDWAGDSWGGMEHHPYSHIGTFDMNDEEVHAHEAGHGWFGDGVRMQCWEDFVLSEGTNSYITAHAMEEIGGPDLWAYYVDDFLVPICENQGGSAVILPETCDEIDIATDPIWSLATYMKGACFYEDVGDLIGTDLLDEVLGDFYQAHVNGTARMQDMLDAIAARTPESDQAALAVLAEEWLYTRACPDDYKSRCRSRQAR